MNAGPFTISYFLGLHDAFDASERTRKPAVHSPIGVMCVSVRLNERTNVCVQAPIYILQAIRVYSGSEEGTGRRACERVEDRGGGISVWTK